MRSDTTSPTLLSRVRETDNTVAWREFNEQYGGLILRYARRFGLQHADAEDVRQMVLARLFQALGRFRYSPQRGRFRSFLACIVSREIARYKSRPNLQAAGVSQVPDAPGESAPTDADWEREWMNHHLRRAVKRLRQSHDPRDLEIFERLLAGDAISEVARNFAMTEPAVHKIKQRIRERLKHMIARQIRDEDHFNG